MLKNYADYTISFKIGNVYVELPAGWTTDIFNDDPELEEFLRKRYKELNPDFQKANEVKIEAGEIEELQETEKKKTSKRKK